MHELGIGPWFVIRGSWAVAPRRARAASQLPSIYMIYMFCTAKWFGGLVVLWLILAAPGELAQRANSQAHSASLPLCNSALKPELGIGKRESVAASPPITRIGNGRAR